MEEGKEEEEERAEIPARATRCEPWKKKKRREFEERKSLRTVDQTNFVEGGKQIDGAGKLHTPP